MELKFDADKHIYLRGEEIIPSVSAVLKKAYFKEFDFSRVDKDVLQAAADYGTHIHDMIENWLINGKEPACVPLELENFVSWWGSNGFKFLSSEQIIDGGWYGGRYDILATDPVSDRRILIDIKTTSSVARKKWQKQLTMYNHVLKCDDMLVLWLHNDKMRTVVLDDLGDEFVEETYRLYTSE